MSAPDILVKNATDIQAATQDEVVVPFDQLPSPEQTFEEALKNVRYAALGTDSSKALQAQAAIAAAQNGVSLEQAAGSLASLQGDNNPTTGSWREDGIKVEQGNILSAQEPSALELSTYHKKLADYVQQVQQMVDRDGQGNFKAYVDSTVLAEHVPHIQHIDDLTDDIINKAIIPIEIIEGLPLVDGLPIWERLEGEPVDYYKIFKEYRDMRYVNVTGSLSAVYQNYIQQSSRSIARLSEELKISGRTLTTLSKIYHWPMRCTYYDRFKDKELELRKGLMQLELESRHGKIAGEILDQAADYLKKNEGKLTPKIALEMLEMGMRYGRISAGMLGDKPGTQANGPTNQTNITVAQTNNSAEQMLNINATPPPEKNTSEMLGILNILKQSGAFDSALDRNTPKNPAPSDIVEEEA